MRHQFHNIREQYLYGEFAIHGKRMVEVIRVDNCNSTWKVFCYIGNCMVPLGAFPEADKDMSYADARKAANLFLEDTEERRVVTKPYDDLPKERLVQV